MNKIPKNQARIARCMLIVGIVFIGWAFAYNLTHFPIDAPAPFFPGQLDIVGYALITLSAFLFRKKIIGYILLGLAGLYLLFALVTVLSYTI